MYRSFLYGLTLITASIVLATPVFATTPTLSLTPTGNGDSVQITVTGAPNSSVLLDYTQSGVGSSIAAIGTTDQNGNLVTTISSGAYGIVSGTSVSVLVGGTSGPSSPSVSWPTVTSTSTLTLNQNGLVVDVGSSATVTATNSSSGTLYVSNNSNPSIANVSISGSTVTITGNVAGSTSVTLCAVGSSTNCPTVYVIVEASGASQLSLSETSASVVEGQNLPITISGGNGNYIIENNSNSSVVQASISNTVLTLSTGSTSGSATIAVCSSDMSECAVVIATVGSSSSAAVSLSNTAPTVAANQSVTVNVYGPTGVSYYVSSNSTPSVVQANLSGTTLTLSGITQGSSQVTVCASTNSCASLTVTVTSAVSAASITLSQNALSLLSGQSTVITITGGAEPYSISGGNTSISQETLNGTSLTVYAVASGDSTVDVCSAGGGCTNFSVTVAGTSTGTTPLVISPSSLTLNLGASAVGSLSGASSYYLSANSSPLVATVSISGSNVTVGGLNSGTTEATICEANNGGCGTLGITVTSSTSEPTTTTTAAATPTTVTSTSTYTFTEYLSPGSQGNEVLQLQDLLQAQGDLTATPNGYFGAQTEKAVLKFQAAHGIAQLGVIGPSTRAALNQLESSTSSGALPSTSDISSMTLSQLKAEAQSIEAELTQILNRISQLGG